MSNLELSEFDRLKSNVAMRILVIGLIRRALEPGCKFDSCPIIIAESQGVNKSTFLESLVGPDFYGEFVGKDLNKDTVIQAMRHWLVEIPEIDRHFKRQHESELKAFISGKNRYERLAFERKHVSLPWNFVLCGTSNTYDLFSDSTGNRRYPIIALPRGHVLSPMTDEERDNLWINALKYYNNLQDKVGGWLPSREELATIDLINTREHYQFSPLYDLIYAYLTVNIEKYSRQGIAYTQLLENVIRVDRTDSVDTKYSKEVPKILRILGWHRGERYRPVDSDSSKRARFWYPGEDFSPMDSNIARDVLIAAKLNPSSELLYDTEN